MSEEIWEKKFWELMKINTEVMLAIDYREEGRRKIDGWIKHKKEQIDGLVANLPKKETHGNIQ